MTLQERLLTVDAELTAAQQLHARAVAAAQNAATQVVRLQAQKELLAELLNNDAERDAPQPGSVKK
ncbi:MAG: hypothetical protein WBC51_04975 [Vicinamibacterales bacterium]